MIDDFVRGERKGAYCGIDTDIGDCHLPDAMPCRAKTVESLAALRTRLSPFDDRERDQLINWGYTLCDAAVRPCPTHPLGETLARTSGESHAVDPHARRNDPLRGRHV